MPPSVDPWTAFLNWLQTIIVPDWSGLIGLLPILLIAGLIGPGLTFLALYWLYVRRTNRRGKVRTFEPEPVLAQIGADGAYAFPANAPYCQTHHLIYPATYRQCPVDGEELLRALPGRRLGPRRRAAAVSDVRHALSAWRGARAAGGAQPRQPASRRCRGRLTGVAQ